MSFGEEMFPFLGRPATALDQKSLLGQGFAGFYSSATLVYFQFVFAAITVVLIAGALIGRMDFRAWIIFVPLWLTFSYTIGAFSIWSPNGFLFKAGIMDFAGGFVIHLSSGISGFTAAYWVRITFTTHHSFFHSFLYNVHIIVFFFFIRLDQDWRRIERDFLQTTFC